MWETRVTDNKRKRQKIYIHGRMAKLHRERERQGNLE